MVILQPQLRQQLELLPCQQLHLVKDLHCVLHDQVLNFDLVIQNNCQQKINNHKDLNKLLVQ